MSFLVHVVITSIKNSNTCKCLYFAINNRYLRAVAYRWLILWLCGYLGWDHSRPLPACIYHHIRPEFPSVNVSGYIKVQDKDKSQNNL